jgi:hypothetical protein
MFWFHDSVFGLVDAGHYPRQFAQAAAVSIEENGA